MKEKELPALFGESEASGTKRDPPRMELPNQQDLQDLPVDSKEASLALDAATAVQVLPRAPDLNRCDHLVKIASLSLAVHPVMIRRREVEHCPRYPIGPIKVTLSQPTFQMMRKLSKNIPSGYW
ncbi:MAG: hypothetical protein Q9188_005095 [Gyalolechia gomerana]